MFLYKLEAAMPEQTVPVVVLAETDEGAFAAADELLHRHFVASPEVKELAIVEKKRVAKGAGYVLETVASE
ncbi:DUF3906 family protein [Gorillibacterium sp. CAU 1737]|uniref:DUF3906 family protein n=1 Tax=Gorillibacterium sp. CAU 1737 TaxID=3140362 RepID=UPI0032611FD5